MKSLKLFFLVALTSQGLAPDSEREKKEFVYDLSLATQGIMVSQYNTGVNYSLGFGVYVDIEKNLSKKIAAFKMFKTEQQNFPFHRSIKSIENLAVRRGIESGLKCAEAFKLIRQIKC